MADRWPAIDILRIVAAHLIVWHHFAIYSGMADVAWASAPEFFRALADHARKVVQVFLVIGGFFAARTLLPLHADDDGVLASPRSARWLGRALLGRFMRLAPWVWLAIIVVLIVGRMLDGRTLAVALPFQVLVNASLLQDVLGVPSLSAGLWYVAIDFQLYGCAALLAWAVSRAAARRRAMAFGAVVVATLLSAWVFNRDASGDAWAPYFMAAYGLGMLACWCSQRVLGSGIAMILASVGVSAALAFDFRDRLMLALLIAWLLVAMLRWRPPAQQDTGPGLGRLHRHADATYALFLLHYPLLRLADAAWAAWLPTTASVQWVGLVLAWALSVVVAHVANEELMPEIGRRLKGYG